MTQGVTNEKCKQKARERLMHYSGACELKSIDSSADGAASWI
jgi:hypothetical protein